jgi:hypothetical protein
MVFCTVCEKKTDLCFEIAKNCKALRGLSKKESSFGRVSPLPNQLFSPACIILLLVLLPVLMMADLFVCFFSYFLV